MFELLLKQGELEEPPVNGEQEKSYLPSIHWFQDPDGHWWRVNKYLYSFKKAVQMGLPWEIILKMNGTTFEIEKYPFEVE